MLTLGRVQNEKRSDTLMTAKGTPTGTVRFMLDLPSMQARQKVKQVIDYFSAVRKNPQTPESRERHKRQ